MAKTQSGGAVAPVPRGGRQQARGGDDRRPAFQRRQGKPVKDKAYSRLGGGNFRNTKKGNPRQGKVFKIGKGGAHIYRDGTRIGGGSGKKPGGGGGKKKAAATPFDITAPITTEKGINTELDALTRLRYREPLQDLDRQVGVEQTHQGNLDGWYNNYLGTVKAAAAGSQAAFQGAQGAAYNQANTAAASEDAGRVKDMQAAQADAASRGAQFDPAVFERSRQAQADRQAQGTAFGTLVGAQGANQSTVMQGRQQVVGAQKLSALSGQQDRIRELSGKRSDLLRERGDFRRSTRGTLIDRERRAVLENQAFGLDAQKAALDAADDAADNAAARARLRATRRGQNITRRGQDVSAETQRRGQDLTDARSRANGGGGAGSLTATQRRNYQANFGQAVSIARGYVSGGKLQYKDKKGKTVTLSPTELVDQIVAKKGYPRPIARAAVQRALHGGVSGPLAKKLRGQFGVKAKGRAKKKSNTVKIGPGGIPVSDVKRVKGKK